MIVLGGPPPSTNLAALSALRDGGLVARGRRSRLDRNRALGELDCQPPSVGAALSPATVSARRRRGMHARQPAACFRLPISLLGVVLAGWLSACDGTGRPAPAKNLDNRRLQTDVAVICHDVSAHAARLTDGVRARLRADASGLVYLFRNPDSLNPRRDTRRSIELALEDLQRCDPTAATLLRSGPG